MIVVGCLSMPLLVLVFRRPILNFLLDKLLHEQYYNIIFVPATGYRCLDAAANVSLQAGFGKFNIILTQNGLLYLK